MAKTSMSFDAHELAILADGLEVAAYESTDAAWSTDAIALIARIRAAQRRLAERQT